MIYDIITSIENDLVEYLWSPSNSLIDHAIFKAEEWWAKLKSKQVLKSFLKLVKVVSNPEI